MPEDKIGGGRREPSPGAAPAGGAAGAAVSVRAPDSAAAPVVFDSPHSGQSFPEGFAPAVGVARLRGYEDRLVDDLIAGAAAQGIVTVAALFPRAYVDPNRAEDDLEEDLVGPDWPDPRNPSTYAERGIGLVFRRLPDGTPIYGERLAHAEVAARIARCWRPYHAALAAALDRVQARWGAVWHVNWHSMRPVGDALSPDPGATRPDFVVSDRDGASAAPEFTAAVAAALGERGHSVAINAPFKGGYIVARHGRPAAGRHSLQVEINRALYLDLETLEASAGFADLQADLTRVARRIAAFARARAVTRS